MDYVRYETGLQRIPQKINKPSYVSPKIICVLFSNTDHKLASEDLYTTLAWLYLYPTLPECTIKISLHKKTMFSANKENDQHW